LTTVGLGDYVPGESQTQNNRHFYKIASTLYLLVGVTVMVWLLQIFSETPEFNLYQLFTLTKDGILTSHRDIVHLAKEGMTIDESRSTTVRGCGSGLAHVASSVTYQRQQNETDEAPISFDPTNQVSLGEDDKPN